MRYPLLLILLLLAVLPAWALRIRECRLLSPATAVRYQKLELGVALDPAQVRNPYDPNEIRVTAEFVSPQGERHRVQGFWYQDFSRCTNCPPPPRLPQDSCLFCNECPEDPAYLKPVPTSLPWRLRFAPPVAGQWHYRLEVTYADTTVSTGPVALRVAPSADPGFVGKHRNGRNFAFVDGRVFWPLGMNVTNTWNNGPYNRLPYRDARLGIARIADQGGNFARLLLIPALFGIEGPDTPPGQYDARQNRAYDLDALLDYAAQRGVYLQLTLMTPDELFNSDAFGRAWQQHPYRRLLPPDAGPSRFFTDSLCRQLLRQRIRYIMARWGYSPAVFGVELMGEADNYGAGSNDQYWNLERANPRNLRRWTDEMLAYARSLAPQHLFTINVLFAFSGYYPRTDSVALYTSPQVDFVQDHYYSSDLNVEHQRAFLAKRAAVLFPGKPYQLAEFGQAQEGNCWHNASSFTAGRYPKGLLFHDLNEMHNTLWSSAFNGSAGPGLYWWANQVFGLCYGGQYHYFRALQSFMADCPIFQEDYTPVASACPCTMGAKDWKHTPSTSGNCIPAWVTGPEDADNPDMLPGGTRVSTEDLEVFALQSPARVVGWVHNRHNYWYKLPHLAGSAANTAYCQALNDNQPTTPDSIPALVGQQVTILHNVRPGRYRLEFFSTYPFYDLNGDGKDEAGGLIARFTAEVRAAEGQLTFTVPPLRPLGTPPFAPDYGFKVTWLPDAPVPAAGPVRKAAPPKAKAAASTLRKKAPARVPATKAPRPPQLPKR